MKNIKSNFNEDTFIYKYLSLCESLETAEDFDFWGAIWILSLLCNRNILINRPNLYLYPNFYIILVANSGIARKSTAISFAKNILNEINTTDKIHILSSTVSSQKFNQTLSKLSKKNSNCVIGINCSEFITFYKNKSLIYQLTDYYDCPNERKGYGTISNGNINIYNLFISSYTGSTPNYYIKAVNEDEICGGFTSRNIIIPAEKGKRRIAWGTDDNSNKEVIRIGKEIQRFIINSKGVCNLSTEAIRRYTNWYNRRRLNRLDLFLQSFESREQDYILKLACLFAINDMTLEISEKHINLAIKFINHYKINSHKYFKDEVYKEDKDDLSILIDKIKKFIYSSGPSGIYHQQLFNHVKAKCDIETFRYIISIMHEFEMIDILQPYKSKALIYRATKNINKIRVKDILNNINM